MSVSIVLVSAHGLHEYGCGELRGDEEQEIEMEALVDKKKST